METSDLWLTLHWERRSTSQKWLDDRDDKEIL